MTIIVNGISISDEFTLGYITCALWASIGDDGSPLDTKYTIQDMISKCLLEMLTDCINFQSENAVWLLAMYRQGFKPASAGQDFWLTRNGHGAGFWDRGLGKLGEDLTRAAKAYGSADLYDVDGKIHCC